MRILPVPLAIAALLLLPPAASRAYQPPVVPPGGTWTCTVTCRNEENEARTASARARLRGHPYWSPPSKAAVRGPWADLPRATLGPGESRDAEIALQVPAGAAGVLDVEVRGSRGFSWTTNARWSAPLVEAGPPSGPGRVPFRLVAGGIAMHDDPDEELENGFVREVVRDGAAFDALRARLGIVSPDSWGLHPDESDASPFDGRNALFAAADAPDLATETLIALRTPEHSAQVAPLRLWIRSVRERADGTLVCRYSWRTRPVRGPVPGIWIEGDYVLAAIPATDAPVEFRRVP